MPVAVEFAAPWWLLALPALAALLVLARLPWWRAARRAGRRALRREGWRLAARLLWSALLILALAGPVLTSPLSRQATVFVLDASESTAPVRDRLEGAVQEAAEQLPRGGRLGVVAAAAGAQVEEMPAAEPLFARLSARLEAGRSDLASGLRLAGAVLPEGYAGRVVLVSDGRQTEGDAVAAARSLRDRGVLVDVLPLGPEAVADIRLEGADLPEVAYEGERSALTARIYSERATEATLRLFRDDALVLERAVALRRGRQEVVLPVPPAGPGLHRYRVEVIGAVARADAIPENNALGAIQRVVGPPRVLVAEGYEGASGLLPAALQAVGAEVTVVPPGALPADLAGWARYDAAILADVPAPALPEGTMELMEAYVRDLGRGLAMTGGPDSFGPGGYADTPVERALPVYMDIRGRGRQPKVAMVLVIDKSGSMGQTKMELAKEAAVRAIRLLRPGDQAGVVAFDSIPQWVAPLTPVEEREALEQAIGAIYAAGGTEIYPAVAAAFAHLAEAEAEVKHILLMTDGQSASGGDYGELLRQMREERITLSTVAVGDDADTGLMEAMARAGRGRYHFAADAASIPEIFARETVAATRTMLVEGRFYPAAASGGPLLRGLSATPPLDGYVAVTPKERAEVVLISPEGDPVLAAWQYGTGRAIAWTPDLTGRWSGAWAGSPAATTLWGNILSWLLPPQEAGELQIAVEPEADGSYAVVVENRTVWEEVRPTAVRLLGPDGAQQEVALSPAGPGRYRAPLGALPPGAYILQAEQETPGGARLRAESGWVAPYPAEYREVGVSLGLLTRVAEAGGGRVLASAAEAVAPDPRRAQARWPLAPVLLVLAALLWPLEIAGRRLALTAPSGLAERLRSGLAPVAEALRRRRRAEEQTAQPMLSTADRLLERKRRLRQDR